MSNPDILLACVLLLLLIVVEIVMAINKRWGFVGMLLRAAIAVGTFAFLHFIIKYW